MDGTHAAWSSMPLKPASKACLAPATNCAIAPWGPLISSIDISRGVPKRRAVKAFAISEGPRLSLTAEGAIVLAKILRSPAPRIDWRPG